MDTPNAGRESHHKPSLAGLMKPLRVFLVCGSRAPSMLWRRISQIRFVFGVGLAISLLDIDITWRNYALFEPKPDLTKIAGAAEGA